MLEILDHIRSAKILFISAIAIWRGTFKVKNILVNLQHTSANWLKLLYAEIHQEKSL